MALRLLQIKRESGERAVVAMSDDARAHIVPGYASVYQLASDAIAAKKSIGDVVSAAGAGEPVDIREAYAKGLVLSPIDHEDPAHLLVTGTGLTHLGSAESRDKMHRAIADGAPLTDSMKMFKLGLDGGKPADGGVGAQPEWFYKGDGSMIAAPGAALASPGFALDGGEEPELAGIYIIGPDGAPYRIGYALGNEFSDHVTENINYLYLAHSKLRVCALGPEIVVEEIPQNVRIVSRIRRGNEIVWEKAFDSGEANMSHSIGNLEHHHFKYALFRRPGDVHVHFFGTAALSFADGVRTQSGDIFEIEADRFVLPLHSTLSQAPAESPIATRQL